MKYVHRALLWDDIKLTISRQKLRINIPTSPTLTAWNNMLHQHQRSSKHYKYFYIPWDGLDRNGEREREKDQNKNTQNIKYKFWKDEIISRCNKILLHSKLSESFLAADKKNESQEEGKWILYEICCVVWDVYALCEHGQARWRKSEGERESGEKEKSHSESHMNPSFLFFNFSFHPSPSSSSAWTGIGAAAATSLISISLSVD